MSSRSEEREMAFLLLFECIFNELPFEEILENAAAARDFNPPEYIVKKVSAMLMILEELDGKFVPYLKNWTKERINKVALCLLRLAVYEIFYERDYSPNISISEAVEISKIYAPQSDTSFINGVLGNLIRDTEQGAQDD